MSYGTGDFGQSSYGGSSFEGGPYLVSSDPGLGAVDVSQAAPITIVVESVAALDSFTLSVEINGLAAIAGGAFQSGYAGTITYDPDSRVTVVISTHPPFTGGPSEFDVFIQDDSGASGTFNVAFTVTADIEAVTDEVVFSEALTASAAFTPPLLETISLSETLALIQTQRATVAETVVVSEDVQTGSLRVEAIDPTTLRVSFPEEVRFTGTGELLNFSMRPTGLGSPVSIFASEPMADVIQTGSSARVLDVGRSDGLSDQLSITGSVTADNIGDYIEVLDGRNFGQYRIEAVLSANTVRLSSPLIVSDSLNGYVDGPVTIVNAGTRTFQFDIADITPSDPIVQVLRIENRTTGVAVDAPAVALVDYRTFQVSGLTVSDGDRVFVSVSTTAKVLWKHTSAVKTILFKVTPKLTASAGYLFQVRNLRTKLANALTGFSALFTVSPLVVPRPRAVSATFLPEDGTVFVRYDQPMRADDANLHNPGDYTITGPTAVRVERVMSLDDTTVGLRTTGFATGDYTLTISTSTPKDVAGNPLDPLFNSLIFTAAVPQTQRSVFTDKGPIAKPPLTLQNGVGGSFQTYNEVSLPGATLSVALIGKMVRLTGSTINGGTFRIASVVSATRARLANASFTLPDAATLTWEVFDPRDGQIADDPSDVTVRVNGSQVVPEAVVGLMGQVLLAAPPDPSDDVKIDYSWVLNPTVDIRRLNSREFRLNSWNRDVGYAKDRTQHKYRFNNTLVWPSDYEPEDMQAPLNQPQLRELHYRAFERAYTPTLNDPTLLLLNSPTHRIAYPASQRTLAESFVNYEATSLPEDNIVNPWTPHGSGTASAALGQLTVIDNTSGPYPTGTPIFWTRPIDLTFPHVFAMSWRGALTLATEPNGVFTGVAAGYSSEHVAVVIGYVLDGGVRKLGILKRGAADDSSLLTAWTGGLDSNNDPTGAPATVDWSALHSYRIFRDLNGTIRVFVDGDVAEVLRVVESELPLLEEVGAPFDGIQGAFFGAVSRPARSTSTWDFIRYLILPSNPTQVAAASFVSYEGNVIPESDTKPWTPVGYHGSATILGSDTLLLDSTSATDAATASDVGLMGGDFRAYARLEPLLTVASEYVLDAELQLRTCTHGISPYGLAMAVDDGSRLTQLCFFPDRPTPKLSYGGRSLPEDFEPYDWQKVGAATTRMAGRILRIEDSALLDGAVYFVDDSAAIGTDDRVVSASTDYMLEFRCRVVSYTADAGGFAGAFAQVYDSARAVGLMLQEVSGTKYVSFHSDGLTLGVSARFAFNWGDSLFHTYRVAKNTSGDLVSLFIDGTFVGTFPYSSFAAPAADPVGQVSFGSSTPASATSLSVVDWAYANAWRVRSDLKRYVGIWKGVDGESLLGYHLPTKIVGRNATVAGNGLGDGNSDFVAANVVAGDKLIIDSGPNRGVYDIASVGVDLTIVGSWPAQPSIVDFRIAKETDWSALHKYRLVRDTTGEVAVLLDADADPIIRVGYNSMDLPASGVGVIKTIANNLPAITFGALDSENISQSSWDYVRYGITKSATELGIAPHHQVLNQWNMMHSPERLFTQLAHSLTSFKSSSTGIVPKTDPDFLAASGLPAWTQLNQGTPLVPATQNFQNRGPYATQTYVSALNRPEDLLNSDGDFSLNDSTLRFEMIVPKDVLYSSLDVIEQVTGSVDLLTPFTDEAQPSFGGLQYQKDVCLTYDGTTLPENDPSASTPWTLVSETPAQVTTASVGGVLTYGTGGVGTRTIYRNDTPLPDHPSLQNEARFRLRLLQDSTGGTGDTQVKFGLSAPGFTIALTFVTAPSGERLVMVVDLNNQGAVVGSVSFDFLDGLYHTYRIVRDPSAGEVRVFIDS